jgi:hypothetical protein
MSAPKLFGEIDLLLTEMPPTPDSVGRILGISLKRDSDADTPGIEAWQLGPGGSNSPYASIDLRMPDPDIGDGTVFLSATLRTDEGIDGAAIGAHYGLGFKTELPSPRYQPGAVPAYLIYDKDWGTLSFGVTADAQRRLIRFVLSTRRADSGPT